MKNFLKSKLLFIITIAFITIGIGTIDANAGSCGYNSGCGCKDRGMTPNNGCAGISCWFDRSTGRGCNGHNLGTTEYISSTATCTSGGVKNYIIYCSNSTCGGLHSYSIPTGALGHLMTGWYEISGTHHKKHCQRGGCSYYQTDYHHYTTSHWVNSGQGFEYKTCGDCRYQPRNWYWLNVTLHSNGGTFTTGETKQTQSVIYYNNVYLPTCVRTGYRHTGWGYYNGNTYENDSTISYPYTLQFGNGNHATYSLRSDVKNGTCNVVLYAQWEKTIKYNIQYLSNSGTVVNNSFYVAYQNYSPSAHIYSYTNGATYATGGNTSNSVFNSGLISISSFKDGNKITALTYNDWVKRGIAKENSNSWSTTIGAIIPSTWDEMSYDGQSVNYYASYERLPSILLKDYGTDKVIFETIYGTVTKGGVVYNTAGLKSNGTVDRYPVFSFRALNTMKFSEATAAPGINKQETWSPLGWSKAQTNNIYNTQHPEGKKAINRTYAHSANLSMGSDTASQTSKMESYGTYVYNANYTKTPVLTYHANGGKVLNSPYTTQSYTRYANINNNVAGNYKPSTFTTERKDSPNAYYTDPITGLTIYTQQHYSYAAPSASNNYWINQHPLAANALLRNKHVNTNNYVNNTAIWDYVPLVTETVYAKWANESKDVSVLKQSVWNQSGKDTYDQSFNISKNKLTDGVAKVTLTVTLNPANTNNYTAENLYIEDYYNSAMWDYVSGSADIGRVNANSDGSIKWTIGDVEVNNNVKTIKATYYVRLKEEYWTKDADGNLVTNLRNYYINPMNGKSTYAASVQAYLDSLIGTINTDGTYDEKAVQLNRDNMYYKESTKSHKSYIYVNYHYGTTDLDGTQRNVAYPVDYVRMQYIKYVPDSLTDITISSNTNNIYNNLDAKDPNTYFVQYDTHSTNNSMNSRFNLQIKSRITRSYQFYQITNNIFDLSTKTGDINNYLEIDNRYKNPVFSTDKLVSEANKQTGTTYNTDGSVLKVYSAFNKRSEGANKLADGRTAYYLTATLTSLNNLYATNQDGLNFDIIPTMITTDAYKNETHSYSDTVDKINLTIDATNPIITPDNRIKTESEKYGKWTESDGYIDINLVNGNTDPIPQTHYLTFTFEDKVSGVNDPRISTSDWIDTINENIQVTLINTDTNKVLFDYKTNDYNKSPYNQFLKVTYDNTYNGKTEKMNKTGSIKLTLDPSKDDFLGHLELTIRVIDNVSNWEEKTYDIYAFCLTGEVNVVDTLPNADEHLPAEIWNGEQGKVSVEAAGWVDRVTVIFENSLIQDTKLDVSQRNDLTGDDYKINGDYPVDNSNLTTSKAEVTYLPKRYLKCRWGYENNTLGGLPLTNAEINTTKLTINNSILNEHLSELINNFILINSYGIPEEILGSDYAIIEDTLYTNPIYNNGKLKQYSHSYKTYGLTEFDGINYPTDIIIDGKYSTTINYTRIYKTNPDTGEVEEFLVSKIEEQSIYSSEWVQTSDGYYLRPFYHYFFMPRNAEPRYSGSTGLKYYLVELTSYKDSEKDFKHEVSIQLRFTNNPTGEPPKKPQTNIKDN